MKSNAVRDERVKSREAAEHAFKKMDELRFQSQEVKNQLDHALSENRKMRIQMDADKSSFEIQVAALKSKLNQVSRRLRRHVEKSDIRREKKNRKI